MLFGVTFNTSGIISRFSLLQQLSDRESFVGQNHVEIRYSPLLLVYEKLSFGHTYAISIPLQRLAFHLHQTTPPRPTEKWEPPQPIPLIRLSE